MSAPSATTRRSVCCVAGGASAWQEEIVTLSRKLGIPTPAEGEPTEAFFYCNQVVIYTRRVGMTKSALVVCSSME